MNEVASGPAQAKSKSLLREVGTILILAALYFLAARLGLSLASVHTNVSPVWPPTGIAIAAALILGYRSWPGILLGAFFANLLTPVPVATTVLISIGNTLEAYSAAWVLRRIGMHDSLDRARDVFKFVIVVMVSTMVSATIGTLSLCFAHSAEWANLGHLWLTWWLGDFGGGMVIAPLVLTWAKGRGHWLPRQRYREGVILLLLLSLSAIVTFGKGSPAPVQYYPLTRLLLPFLLWAAFRLGRRGVTVAIVVTSAFAVWGTSHGAGPFISGNANDSLLLLQLYLATNSITFLFLSAVVEEKWIAEQTRGHNEERLATNLAITRILAESPALHAATHRILKTIATTLGWQVGAFWIPDQNSNVLRNLVVWRSPTSSAAKFEERSRTQTFESGVGLPGRVWQNRKAAWIPDVATDNNFPRAPVATAEGLHAAFAFPIVFNEKFLGLMEFFSVKIREPDEPLLNMFESIGKQIGLFMERKRGEEALLENQAWLRLTMQGSKMGTWTRDLDESNRVIWSPELEQIFGLEPGEFPQTEEAFFDYVHPDDREKLAKAVGEAVENQTAYDIEFRYHRKDGSQGWMLGRGRAFYDATGRPYRLAGLGWDITERKRTEEVLEFVSHLPEENPEPVIRLTGGQTVSYANPAARAMLESLSERGNEAPPEVVEAGRSTLLHGVKRDIELVLANRTYLVTLVPIAAGNYVNLYFSDITARKRAEEALRENQEALRLAHKIARGGTWQWDLLTNTMQWSEEYYELLGLSPAETTASFEEWSSRVHPDDLPLVLAEHEQAINEKRDVDIEFRVRRTDGEWRWFHRTARCIFDSHGKPISMIGITFDTTERRKTDVASRQLAAIVQSTDDAIIGKDLNGIITSWNPAAERLYGYKAEEIIGQSVSILIPPDRPNEEPDILDRLRRGLSIDHYETLRISKDGRRFDVSLTVSPIKNAEGKIIGASKIARDITEQKRAEREIVRLLAAERAAREEAEIASRTKDEFLATLSHELRTPLTAILGWLSILRGRQLDEETTKHAIETIERNARAQAQLIEDLMDVSRIVGGKLSLEVAPIELLPVLNAAVEVVRPAADAKQIDIKLNYDSTAGPVSGDAARLQQVVWNLLSNSVKFTPRNGTVEIAVRRSGSSAEIVVRDSGIGISPDFLPHVFERFRQADSAVTRSHRGMGLGLAIVRHLIELHGGTVFAYSEGENRGATFTIHLPLAAVTNEQAIRTTIAPEDRTQRDRVLNGVRILLVEDEPDARELIALVLKGSGAQVEAVETASDALRRLPSFAPDLLLSDIGLPLESGYDLIRKVRSLSSDIKRVPAIALTAFATENDRRMSLSVGFQAHLAKPVEPAQLVNTIRGLLNGKP